MQQWDRYRIPQNVFLLSSIIIVKSTDLEFEYTIAQADARSTGTTMVAVSEPSVGCNCRLSVEVPVVCCRRPSLELPVVVADALPQNFL